MIENSDIDEAAKSISKHNVMLCHSAISALLQTAFAEVVSDDTKKLMKESLDGIIEMACRARDRFKN